METDLAATAWVLGSAFLVLLLAVGLGAINAGRGRATSAVSMMMFAVGAIGVVSITWIVVGFTLAFGGDGALVGDFRFTGLGGVGSSDVAPAGLPAIAFVIFTLMVAVVAAVALTGVAADRMRFGPMLGVLAAWSVLVLPVALHWTVGGGWLAGWGAGGAGGAGSVGAKPLLELRLLLGDDLLK